MIEDFREAILKININNDEKNEIVSDDNETDSDEEIK